MSDLNNNKSVDQSEKWRNFYAFSWAVKLQYLQQLISQGERNPMRLIQLLQQTERKYYLGFNSDTKTYGWKKTKIDNPLPSGTPAIKKSSFKGNFVDIPFYTNATYTHFILDFLQEAGDVDCIVELGCGYGKNLFEMHYYGGPLKPYYGGELTEAGQALGTELAALNSELDFSFHPFDHIAPDLSWLPSYEKVFFMTVHSIEQVHKINIDFFRCLTNAAPQVIGLHLEPFGFQKNPGLGPATKEHEDYFRRNEWNVNFYETLLSAQDEGLIKIDYIETELFHPDDLTNPTSLAIWRK